MTFVKNSDLDKSANLDVDDFVKAFSLNPRLERAVKYIVRYSAHSKTKAGISNLQKAISELESELKFNGGCNE